MASSDHDVDEAVGVFSSEALTVALCTLHIVRSVACLVYASHSCGSEQDDGVGGGPEPCAAIDVVGLFLDEPSEAICWARVGWKQVRSLSSKRSTSRVWSQPRNYTMDSALYALKSLTIRKPQTPSNALEMPPESFSWAVWEIDERIQQECPCASSRIGSAHLHWCRLLREGARCPAENSEGHRAESKSRVRPREGPPRAEVRVALHRTILKML